MSIIMNIKNENQKSKNNYYTGGTMPPDHPTYVIRDADQELESLLIRGEYCYILTAKRMGKSSSCKRIMKNLDDQYGIIPIWGDLQIIQEKKSEEIWYDSFVVQLRDEIAKKLPDFPKNYYWEHLKGDCLTRLNSLFKKVLEITKKDIVIVIDEIDKLLLLEFNTDSLFDYIRYCHNYYRSDSSLDNHLTFCLIGTGSPSDFIENKNTSFNIGNGIEISGLEFVKAKEPLLNAGLRAKFKDYAESILSEVFYWTNGQPFLTQKLCQILVETSEVDETDIKGSLEKCVDEYIIKNSGNEELFKYITIQMTEGERAVALLQIYKDILKSEHKRIKGNDRDPEHIQLRLSGLVIRTKNGYLEPFNLIYQRIFDIEWVEQKLAAIPTYAEKFNNWKAAREELKSRYLLYGEEYKEALKWKESQKQLPSEHYLFFEKRESFLQRVIDRFPEGSNHEAIIHAVLFWTGGLNFFNEQIFKMAGRFEKPSDPGDEEAWIKKNFIDKLTTHKDVKQNVENHIEKIEGNFLHDPDPCLLLSIYREILGAQEVEFNKNTEYQRLIDMCLIIKEDGKLKILNKIYYKLFNEDWINQKLRSIITNLVGAIWQSATDKEKSEAKSEAVDMIIKFNPQLKGKTNPLYGFIQKVLEHTASDRDLLKNLLEKACEQENIPSEQQDEWIDRQLRLLKPNDISQEILAWIKSYEKAIVARNPQYSKAKEIIDIAFCKLVEQLVEFPNDTEPQNSDIDTVMRYCIKYLAKNFIALGIWNKDDRPNIKQEGENRWEITVSNCSYQDECKWALDETAFVDNEKKNEAEKYKKYRCQRLGCCVGAVKKYMKDNNLPEDQIKKVNYFMETAIETTEEDMNAGIKCKCIGLISIN